MSSFSQDGEEFGTATTRLLIDEFAKQAALEESVGSNRIAAFVDQVCEMPQIFGREA
jgi:quinol monooxygenase YgiN